MQSKSSKWNASGKTAIVTGANTGIGKCTALELARSGVRVILACRNPKAADDTADEIRRELGFSEEYGERMVSWRHLDLSSLESVRRFAGEILANEPKLHILVNNAGVLPPDRRQMTFDGRFELTFATNHLGPFLLTNLLMPLLKASAPSRIIVVSSVGYKMCKRVGGYNIDDPQYAEHPENYEPWMAYCQTKLANILFVRSLAQTKLNAEQDNAVSVFAVHPGMVKTDIFRHRSVKFSLSCGLIVACFGKTPRKGAKSVIYCATQPGIEDKSGSYFVGSRIEELESIATDDAIADRLWRLSESLTTDNGTN